MLKRLNLTILSLLCVSLISAAPSRAESPEKEISAVDLVQLARNGYLQDQGIAQFNQLASDYNSGQVCAEDVVEAAIADDRLSPETLTDNGYLATVDHCLDHLDD
ncbi:MAG: hypothetical protein ACLFM4_00435 [Phormidium sp.]|nr:MAG: hypothetical protein HLUCCO16_02105 [Phormidium sp. OSCR]